MKALRSFTVRPSLPAELTALEKLAMNLRWSWDDQTRDLFRWVDPEQWDASTHDPVRLLGLVGRDRLESLAADPGFMRFLDEVHTELLGYLSKPRWFQAREADTALRSVAYFSPEFGIAFFGGDPDNFTYPRYDLDITFFRVYENDKPVHLDHHLQWSKSGAKDGELIFVSGHPGNTDRLKTLAQMDYLRDVDYPSRLGIYKERIEVLQKFSTESPENARIAQEEIFSYQNSQKAITGYLEGVRDQVGQGEAGGGHIRGNRLPDSVGQVRERSRYED